MEYAVLGGGALGLGAAYRLAQAGHSVVVFEQEASVGGLAAGFRVGDTWLEKFYHHLFRTDTTIIKLIQELGLGGRLEWSHPRTVFLINGQFHQFDSPLTLLKFQPLRFHERLRVGAVGALLKATGSGLYEGRTAEPWLRRWMGKRPYNLLFRPLFACKFGELADQIALPWFWARFHDRTTQLGYLRGGFQLIYEALAERIQQAGSKVFLETRVESVERQGNERWEVRTSRGSWNVDRVISTLPTRLTCRLVPSLPDDYKARYDWGQAYGAQCVILSLDRPLTRDSYWINPVDPGYPFTSLVEHTNYRSPSEYGGRHLLYLGNYRAMHDPIFRMSKEDLLAEFLPHLKRLNPAFSPEWVQESWLFQAPFAQPIVTTDYRQHIPPLRTPLAGLWVANMFQVYPHDRGQNYSFELVERLMREIQ
ncbi:MAG TPA: NAD(P)/FAD-dependent oxidoreductase [Ktedonobacteraceae bacterium]|nr:NAD(P)/FAD-dependent oxidoreductase [Ktedonobacteraceae bacterium]